MNEKLIQAKKDYLMQIRKHYLESNLEEMLTGDMARMVALSIQLISTRVLYAVAMIDDIKRDQDKIELLDLEISFVHKVEIEITRVISQEKYWRD